MYREEFEQLVEDAKIAEAKPGCHVNVCTSSGCIASGSLAVKASIEEAVKKRDDNGHCKVRGVGCMGLCSSGPIISIDPDNVLYEKVTSDDANDIVHSIGNDPVKRIELPQNTPFFERQERVVLSNAGKIEPDSLESALAHGAYQGLLKAASEMAPGEVLREITESGLRGRGGAGYPTGLKWKTVAKMNSKIKYVVCNADEGDPGAFMDRTIMETDPHRVIEGLAIAAYAVGANIGYIYIRAEYALCIKPLRKAVREVEEIGILGKHIFGSPFNFTVEIRLGAGAFVCGEETALMASIEGKRGNPRPRPPYPAEHGLWGKPTLINNVETFANIAPIITNGSQWYASIGTEKSKGTKVFAVSGKINRVGVIEVPMGIPLREIVEDICGGVPEGCTFKAVQTGGSSGGCIPAEHLDTPVEFDTLRELGSIMGSGGMIILDNTSSIIKVAHYFLEFSMEESCGKCSPCRVGNAQIYDLLTRFLDGIATEDDLYRLEDLCDVVKSTSLCGLGQASPNPVISTLRYFRDEYLQQIVTKPELEPA